MTTRTPFSVSAQARDPGFAESAIRILTRVLGDRAGIPVQRVLPGAAADLLLIQRPGMGGEGYENGYKGNDIAVQALAREKGYAYGDRYGGRDEYRCGLAPIDSLYEGGESIRIYGLRELPGKVDFRASAQEEEDREKGECPAADPGWIRTRVVRREMGEDPEQAYRRAEGEGEDGVEPRFGHAPQDARSGFEYGPEGG